MPKPLGPTWAGRFPGLGVLPSQSPAHRGCRLLGKWAQTAAAHSVALPSPGPPVRPGGGGFGGSGRAARPARPGSVAERASSSSPPTPSAPHRPSRRELSRGSLAEPVRTPPRCPRRHLLPGRLPGSRGQTGWHGLSLPSETGPAHSARGALQRSSFAALPVSDSALPSFSFCFIAFVVLSCSAHQPKLCEACITVC